MMMGPVQSVKGPWKPQKKYSTPIRKLKEDGLEMRSTLNQTHTKVTWSIHHLSSTFSTSDSQNPPLELLDSL